MNDAPVGTRMTGTYQRLDSNDSGSQQDYGTNYGSPQGDGTSPPSPTSVSSTSLQINLSASSERLQPENGVIEDEHESVSTNTTSVSSML